MSEGISDSECVQRLQQGETDAFELLVRRHQTTIFNLIYRMLGDYDEAAEIAQEAFLSAYKSIGQFRGEANFSTWLYRIALNHANTRRNSIAGWRQRTVPLDGDHVDERIVDPALLVEQREIQHQVQIALNSLPSDDASIIVLKDIQDVPYEQMATMLNLPVGTVKSRLHRARQALKAKLAPFFSGDGKQP
ncbi:MAG TPA: sigma-70 family RNA polymerase sigma factor [Candidatus Binatia bacterium]|nr:sigma-70 family RNA polymerase sigma factor [Candidatus Binatia bacterium]